jgi:hypothetical protein
MELTYTEENEATKQAKANAKVSNKILSFIRGSSETN